MARTGPTTDNESKPGGGTLSIAKQASGDLNLKPEAMLAFRAMRPPASDFDRPGYWLEAVVLLQNGHQIVEELLGAKVVRRGGKPADVPATVSKSFPRQTRSHAIILARLKAKGAAFHPSSSAHLSVTWLGWKVLEVIETKPGKRRKGLAVGGMSDSATT